MSAEEDRPSIEELIERSSLGTPEAKRMRAQADPELVERVMDRVRELQRDRVAEVAAEFLRRLTPEQYVEFSRVAEQAGMTNSEAAYLFAADADPRMKP